MKRGSSREDVLLNLAQPDPILLHAEAEDAACLVAVGISYASDRGTFDWLVLRHAERDRFELLGQCSLLRMAAQLPTEHVLDAQRRGRRGLGRLHVLEHLGRWRAAAEGQLPWPHVPHRKRLHMGHAWQGQLLGQPPAGGGQPCGTSSLPLGPYL